MKVTKLELQQSLNRVNADLVHALEQLSEVRGDMEAVQAIRRNLERTNDELVSKVEDLCVQLATEKRNVLALNTELAFANARCDEADHRARKLIRAHNIARSTEVSERRKAMEAAKARAMATGQNVVVGG